MLHTQAGRSMGGTASQAFLVFYIFPGSLLTLLQIMLVPAEARTGRGRIMSIYKMLCLAEYIILSIIPHRFI